MILGEEPQGHDGVEREVMVSKGGSLGRAGNTDFRVGSRSISGRALTSFSENDVSPM
jgi:hypothetical protein